LLEYCSVICCPAFCELLVLSLQAARVPARRTATSRDGDGLTVDAEGEFHEGGYSLQALASRVSGRPAALNWAPTRVFWVSLL
jgi:hypothetical protein